MLELALSFALARALAAPTPSAPPPPVSTGVEKPLSLETFPQVATLCAVLEPTERLAGGRDVVAHARAEAQHDERREAALSGSYEVKIRGDQLLFGPYDPDEGVLSLSYRTLLFGAGGSLGVWAVHDADLPVQAGTEAATRIMRAIEHKSLVLVLVFTLPDDADEVFCSHVPGSRRFGLAVEPFRWEYREGNLVLARGGEGGDKPLLTAAEGAKPEVLIAEGEGTLASDFKAALEGLRPALQGCYVEALRKNPGLDGAYVAEIDLAEGGERHVRPAIESLQDESMTSCVTAVLARADLRRAGQATVPIHFELAPPSNGP
jgi:hypothetical protein